MKKKPFLLPSQLTFNLLAKLISSLFEIYSESDSFSTLIISTLVQTSTLFHWYYQSTLVMVSVSVSAFFIVYFHAAKVILLTPESDHGHLR